MTSRKARRAVEDALNGDAEKIDAAVRRGLFAITTEVDEHTDSCNVAHDEMLAQLKAIRRLLVTTAVTFTVTLGTALVSLAIR